jgi:hypothetical protein
MPEELLLELESVAPVAAGLERVVKRDVELAVEAMKGSAATFEKAWQRIVLDVSHGQTTELHAARPRLLAAFENRLRLLKQIHVLAKWLQDLDESNGVHVDVLLPEIAAMDRLKASVFDRWRSASDLEDLAARDYPLTTADLDKLGPQCRPPATYYVEESKPF